MRIALALLAVVLVGGCGVVQVKPVPATPIPVPPLRMSATPAWSTAKTGFPGRPNAVRVEDLTALVDGYQGFQVIDTRAGTAKSTVTTDTDLGDGGRWDPSLGRPVLVDGTTGEVIAPYRRGDQVGLTSLVNGHDVRLGDATVGAGGALATADDGTALMTVASPADPTRVDKPADLRMVAFDSRTGDHRWDGPAMWPVAITDGLVLGVTGATHRDPRSNPQQGAAVSAVDVMTGQPAWSLADTYAASDIVLTARDLVVVSAIATGETMPKLVVVSAKTGEHVADLGESGNGGCATDDVSKVVCATSGHILSVVDLAGQRVTTVPCPDQIEAVGPDRLYVGSTAGPTYSIDLTGKRVDQLIPGIPKAQSLDQLVIDDGNGISGYPLS